MKMAKTTLLLGVFFLLVSYALAFAPIEKLAISQLPTEVFPGPKYQHGELVLRDGNTLIRYAGLERGAVRLWVQTPGESPAFILQDLGYSGRIEASGQSFEVYPLQGDEGVFVHIPNPE